MEIDIAVRTLFAEFQEAVFRRFELEHPPDESGTFVSKTLKGKKYWYGQRYVDGKMVQKYHAPSTPQNDHDIFNIRKDRQGKKILLRKLLADEQNRAAMLKRGGLPILDPLTSSVLKALSDALLIYKGGVLVGSYAFWAYAGMLGQRFEGGLLKTLDIDMAFDPLVAMPLEVPVSLLKLLKSVDEHFREVPGFLPKYSPHSYIGLHGLRVDVLAPLRGKHRGSVRLEKIIGAAAEPVRFLDFLMKKSVSAVLIGPGGGIPVTVPHPARYAVHKLIVAARRPVTESSKRAKDIAQAGTLIDICLKEEPAELKNAFREAQKEGKKWRAYLLQSLKRLPTETQAALSV
ncbi:MAG: GSU2403 family nucleotidyltransferase fold protein [Deltaproteobacteria bacterium]|nr:GSU2403 family nucleotidyltransferase fold protein [Deltaproteobacteria bacterium]